jgi:hypothetical protein
LQLRDVARYAAGLILEAPLKRWPSAGAIKRVHSFNYNGSLCPKPLFSFLVAFIPMMFSIQAVANGKHKFE